MKNNYSVIKRPIISEKSSALTELGRKYVFEVSLSANKFEIRNAVEVLFSVSVESVRTSVVAGKYRRTAKAVVKNSNWKKAIVTLSEGQKIDYTQG